MIGAATVGPFSELIWVRFKKEPCFPGFHQIDTGVWCFSPGSLAEIPMVKGSERSWADHNICASLTTLGSGEITKFAGKGSPRDKAFSKSASLHSLTFPAHSWGLMWEANRCVYVFVCTSLFPTSSMFRPRLGCGSGLSNTLSPRPWTHLLIISGFTWTTTFTLFVTLFFGIRLKLIIT